MAYNTRTLKQEILARKMLLAGYTSHIVMLEASLSYKQLRRVVASLKKEGGVIDRESRTMRTGATIITSYRSKVSASILMQLYRNIGGEPVFREIKLNALHTAYQMYIGLLGELPSNEIKPLCLSDAWSLARELRSAEAMYEHCERCGCDYFTSVNQRTSVDCPFCSQAPESSAARARKEKIDTAA